MKARRKVRDSRSVGSVVESSCSTSRANGPDFDDLSRTPLIMMGGMALLMGGMAVFIASITKDERQARAEKDRAVAKALRDGTLTSYMDAGGPVAGSRYGG